MHNWFNVAVKYEKTAEEGRIVKTTEHYLFDALTFTECEERANKEMEPFISGEFKVFKITRAKIAEIFESEDGDKWFKCKVNFVSIDEEKGVERKIPATMVVQACDIKDAYDVLENGMKGSMADYHVASISETPILDIYKYKSE